MLEMRREDLSRPVYAVLGILVDSTTMSTAAQEIRHAAASTTPFLVSTPNLNFLVHSQTDQEFRRSVLESDLSLPDGMPVVWLLRLLGAAEAKRVAGSDVFEVLKDRRYSSAPLRIFLFGGPPGSAEEACQSISGEAGGLQCVGWCNPGFGDIETMSTAAILSEINASGAQFLSVSLGAQKGQAWLLHNHSRIMVPVRVHLGATINFQTGDIKRAPEWLRRFGFEWLWRIKEEPHLLRRYTHDGWKLLTLLVSRVAPLVALHLYGSLCYRGRDLRIDFRELDEGIAVTLSGGATAQNVDYAISLLRPLGSAQRPILMDLSRVNTLDARFTGLLLMLKKQIGGSQGMRLVNVPKRLRAALRLNGFQDLLE